MSYNYNDFELDNWPDSNEDKVIIKEWGKKDLQDLLDFIIKSKVLYEIPNTLLVYAVGACNEDLVNLLTKHDPSTDKKLLSTMAIESMIKEFSGDSKRGSYIYNCNVPLHRAVVAKSDKIASVLIKNGADINYISHDCNLSALTHAIENNSFDLVKLLIEHGANINLVDFSGNVPLLRAVEPDWHKMHKILPIDMDKQKVLIHFLTEDYNDVSLNDKQLQECVETILNKNKRVQMIEFLLKNGANVIVSNANYLSPLYHALNRNNFYKLVDILRVFEYKIKIKDNDTYSKLTKYIFMNLIKENYNIIKLLLENRKKINGGKNYAETLLLHWAVQGGKVSIVKELLDSGVDINSKTINGSTCLYYVSNSDLSTKINFLAEEKINAVSLLENQLDCDLLQVKFVKFLIENGADINIKHVYGRKSTLTESVFHNNYEVTKLFLENGANVSYSDFYYLKESMEDIVFMRDFSKTDGSDSCKRQSLKLGYQIFLLLLNYSNNIKENFDRDYMPFRNINLSVYQIICQNCNDVLALHLEKMFALGLCEKKDLSRKLEESTYFPSVQKEVESLKNTKLFLGSNITFYDVLTKPFKWLVKHMFLNNAYKERQQTESISKTFPIYESIIQANLDVCYCRISLMRNVYGKIVDHICVLPIECSYTIFEYLPNCSLNSFLWIFKH